MRVVAGVVWPIAAPPIPQGALLIDSTGRIRAVGSEVQLAGSQTDPTVRYPDALVIPGLVNAHTHLELHHLGGATPDPDFARWLAGMRRVRESTDEETYAAAAAAGLRDVWRYGVTMIADTGTSGATARALSDGGGRGIYYQEVIGPEPAQADDAMARLVDAVGRLRREVAPSVTIGVSPHAPYTVHPTLLARAVEFARVEGMPLAGHLAESAAEVAFVSAHAGPLADGWRTRGIALPPRERSPVAAWARGGVLGPDFLGIHLTQADDEDIAVLARTGTAVVLCPRSNSRHGHGAPPVAALHAAGLRVGLGTDSLVSVDSLDLMEEGRSVRRLAGLDPLEVVRILTLDGAAAVGLEASVGSLEAGKWADFCVLGVAPPAVDPETLAEAVLGRQPSDVLATYVAGRPVYRVGEER